MPLTALNDLYTSLRALVAAVWPEVVADGIYEAATLELIPWQSTIVPYSVIVCGKGVRDPDDTTQFRFDIPVTLLYVANTPTNRLDPVRTAVDLMLQALVVELATVQMWTVDAIDWSDDLPANAVVKLKQYGQHVGSIDLTAQVGYYRTS